MDIQQGRGLRQHDDPVVVQVSGVTGVNGQERGIEIAPLQLGIVSVGSDDCGLHGAPSIYTRVSSFTDWVLDTLRD